MIVNDFDDHGFYGFYDYGFYDYDFAVFCCFGFYDDDFWGWTRPLTQLA